MFSPLQNFPLLKPTSDMLDYRSSVLSLRFPQKLWKIINECQSGAIRWGISGKTIVLDYKKFQLEYLNSKYPLFKTKNITSFIRQLNLYGFRKVASQYRGLLCPSNRTDVHEFKHEDFQCGRLELLANVSRKVYVAKHKFSDYARSNRYSGNLGKLGPDASLHFKRPKSRIISYNHDLKRELENPIQCYANNQWETNDPLEDVLNADSTDAITELFGFDINAIPNAESGMEWVFRNSNLLAIDENDPEDVIIQHPEKILNFPNMKIESMSSKYTAMAPNERNTTSQILQAKIPSERTKKAKCEVVYEPGMIIPENYQLGMDTELKMADIQSSQINQRQFFITLYPNKIYSKMPARSSVFHDNFYYQLTKAYRLF